MKGTADNGDIVLKEPDMSAPSMPIVVMASISFYVGLYHLLIYLRRRQHREDLIFALLCLATGLYDVCCVGLYDATSVAEGAQWQRAQFVALALFTTAFLWFIPAYTHQKPQIATYAFSAFFMLALVVQLVDRSNLTWMVEHPSIKEILLPFGLKITYYEVLFGPFTTLQSLMGMVASTYILWNGARFYRRGYRREAGPLLLALCLMYVAAVNDTAVSNGMYQFVYAIEYAYMAMILLMAYSLSTTVVQAAMSKEALKESEARFRSLVETTSDWVWEIDQNGVYTYASPKVSDFLGYEPAEVVGQTPFDLMPPDEAEHTGAIVRGIMADRRPFERMENTALHKDGRRVVLETNGVPFFDTNGKLLGYRGIDRDITERRQVEAEREQLLVQVQEQGQRVQEIMDTVPEGVLLLDSNCRVVLANPQGKKDLATLANAQVEDILTRLGDRQLVDLLTSPPKGLWHEVATDRHFFQVLARPIEDGPTPQGWVLVIRNMTQQYEAERHAQQQERLAAVGQLAAGIAHDFNNILAVITLYAGLLARIPDLPDRVYERLGTIHRQAQRASNLIQQILDFSRRAVLERGPMDMVVFLKEQAKLLERTLPENIKVELTYGKDEYVVNGDPTRLQQAIINLASNARDAMPEDGCLRIELERIRIKDAKQTPLPDMPVDDWVTVSVSDTGAGISPDALPHIFEPFFTTKAAGEGTGLGLAQVYGIVKQHEGIVDVKTEEGVGTTFTLYLPALATPRPEPSRVGIERPPQGHGETILVVEDNAATRGAVVDSLEVLGYQVLEATNGQQALAAFEQHAGEIALVLSDVVMPEMSGQALFQALRQQDTGIKVVLMTGHPLERQLESLRAEGLISWLPKPPSVEDLARVIAQALNE
jgi:two-component system cell cycle sensor histidine kinase/response regulator CckA